MSEIERKMNRIEVAPFSEKMVALESQLVLLSALFFRAKYERMKITAGEYKEVPPDPAQPDFLKPLSWYFNNVREATGDIEGDIVGFVAGSIKNNPNRGVFSYLPNEQIEEYCSALEEMFENQEFCARCESWTYFDIEPEDFPVVATADMLDLIAHSSITPLGRTANILLHPIKQWPHSWRERQERVKKILQSLSKIDTEAFKLLGQQLP